MTLIEQITADREAGTPGPWAAFTDDTAPHTNIVAVVPHTSVVFSLPGRYKSDADIQRACRVPAMEDALIAAAEFVEDMQQVHDGFDLGEPHDHVGHYINKFMAALEKAQ